MAGHCGVVSILVSCLLLYRISITVVSSEFKGPECIACTVGVGILVQLTQVHNESVTNALQKLCDLIRDVEYNDACKDVVQHLEPVLVELLYLRLTPEHVCSSLNVCEELPTRQPRCQLFHNDRDTDNYSEAPKSRMVVEKYAKKLGLAKFPPFCEWPGVKYFCEKVRKIWKLRLPVVDGDDDYFSSIELLRGSSWRGRDCNDYNSNHHPGARPIDWDIEEDSNCNGIYGVDYKSGVPYEKLLCAGSEQRGILLLGDSAGAHFHIPAQWLHPPSFSREIFTHLPFVVSNEFDWPMMSAGTGYINITWPIVDGDVLSAYYFLRQHNLCNHRDYQNLGVNGGDSKSVLPYLDSFKRNNETDYPLLVVYEFVGNDVCNQYNDTLAKMTTVEEMTYHVLFMLRELDKRLPSGSHLLLMGLADGRILWDALHRRWHPLGELNHDVSYPDFYDYLSCLELNPCNGWMTSNATLRDLTSERAQQLSLVLRNIATETKHNYNNFDVEYIDCPISEIIAEWEARYGNGTAWQLIEPADGFHPNQIANKLFADHIWQDLKKRYPHFIGPTNPNNRRIADIFGDQGGY